MFPDALLSGPGTAPGQLQPQSEAGFEPGTRCLLRPLFSSKLGNHRKAKHVGATGPFSFAWPGWISWAPALASRSRRRIEPRTPQESTHLHYPAYQRTPSPDAAPTLEPRLLPTSGRGHVGAARGEALAVEIWLSVRTSELAKAWGVLRPSLGPSQRLEAFEWASRPQRGGHFRGTWFPRPPPGLRKVYGSDHSRMV